MKLLMYKKIKYDHEERVRSVCFSNLFNVGFSVQMRETFKVILNCSLLGREAEIEKHFLKQIIL